MKIISLFFVYFLLGISKGCEEDDNCTTSDDQAGAFKNALECNRTNKLTTSFSRNNKCSTKRYLICCPIKSRAKEACESFGQRPPKPFMVEDHIIGGLEADVAEFPHFAALGYDENENETDFKCGGVLISKNFVLTAAHCFKRSSPHIVRLGKTCLDPSDHRDLFLEIDVGIKNFTIHPKYTSRKKDFDIALIELERDVTFSYNVFPACLSVEKSAYEPMLLVSGFGIHDKNTGAKKNFMLKGNVSEVVLDECKKRTEIVKNQIQLDLNENIICAHSQVFDTCQGDSGSGLMKKVDGKFFVVGITSVGLGCGHQHIPSFYTRVSEYIDWIENKVWNGNDQRR